MLELARSEDRGMVNILAQQLHSLYVQWRPDIYAPAEELYPLERFETDVRQRRLYVAKIAGIVVGYVLLTQCTSEGPGLVRRKIMRLDEVCVQEACRNQGIGRQMMEDTWALAKAFGYTDIQLGVYPQNDEAVGFFQKCGFTIRNIEMQRKV